MVLFAVLVEPETKGNTRVKQLLDSIKCDLIVMNSTTHELNTNLRSSKVEVNVLNERRGASRSNSESSHNKKAKGL